jgi:hypothetical protein
MEDNPWDGIDGETWQAISRRASDVLASSRIDLNPWDGVAEATSRSSDDMFALVADDGLRGASILWEMHKDGHDQTRDRSWQTWWLDRMLRLPKRWDGLFRLGYMNRFFFRTETNKDFVMFMALKVFKKRVRYRRKISYYAGWSIYHILLVRALDALRLGPVVLDIASFLVRPNDLLFFRRFIHRRSSREDIDAFLTERFRNIIL